MLSGVVPQISLICGPCAGGAAYSPALTDFIIQTRDGLHVHHRTGRHQAGDRRGGHGRGTGRRARADEQVRGGPLRGRKRRGGDAPSASACSPSCPPTTWKIRRAPKRTDEGLYNPELNEIVPEDAKLGYDVRDVITRIVDRADFLEVHAEFARNVVVGFGRMRGPHGRGDRQPALGAGRGAGYQCLRQGRRASSASATPSTFRWSRWWMSPGSCPAWTRNTAASSGTAPSCCSPIRRPPFPKSP